MKKVCFIGHSQIGNNEIEQRLKDVVKTMINQNCMFFTMGTHGEFDELALKICKEFKTTNKNMEIEVVFTSYGTLKNRIEQYKNISTTIYDIGDTYYKNQIKLSNRKMIDSCNILICYVDKKRNPSGAKSAMNYAIKRFKNNKPL